MQINSLLKPGETIALLGRSGSGKTSLLRALAGLPSAFEELDRDVTVTPLPTGMVAWMDQQDELMPWRTAAQNLALGADLRGEKFDQQRAQDILSAVGLTGHAEKYPWQMSGGMRQRTALARTLMENRPYVLMDEPFSALDALTRADMQALCARLLRDRSVLIVTHDPIEALRMAHRIFILDAEPIRLSYAIEPKGAPLRSDFDPELWATYETIMKMLGGGRV